jgi:hypothetical protein
VWLWIGFFSDRFSLIAFSILVIMYESLLVLSILMQADLFKEIPRIYFDLSRYYLIIASLVAYAFAFILSWKKGLE